VAAPACRPWRSPMSDLRTYITGIGSSGAVLGAVIVAFVTLAGLVAFNGMPGAGEDEAPSGADVFVSANAPSPAAAEPKARRKGSGKRQPRKASPSGPRRARSSARRPSGRGGSPSGAGQAPSGIARPDRPSSPGSPPPPSRPPAPPATKPPPASKPPPPPHKPPASNGGGPVEDIVDGVDDTVSGATGVDPGLGAATMPITGAVDGALDQILPRAGARLQSALPDATGALAGG